MRVFTLVALAATILATSAVSPARAQEVVVGADMTARVEADGSPSSVSLRYRVRLGSTTDSIPLLWIGYRGTSVENVSAETGQPPVELELELAQGPSGRRSGILRLPRSGAAGPVFTFDLNYQVVQDRDGPDGSFDLILPVLMVDWTPEDSREELFTAELALPPSYAIVEMFPTVPRELRAEEGLHWHALSLPVVPSFFRLRGREGPRHFLTFGRMVDLSVVLFILALAVFGWRMMRRPAQPVSQGEGQ
ncbi:hypothetical protein ACFL3S_03110 [Gemmatimonadota bacterium]